ncbi:gliding motility-associated C-terminal domain-containing protein [Aurantibacillus circumpalustris]|uniref:T9SS type B sorting domain-containing protein n=1 Tax=Aurantibacillus circumpalustris TaxID=3036359 RepID=UPI00295BFC75|nr:gliding motility-associated C-terminal domain-containing protein [Aurantibacillus circumpalustris]
MFGQLNPPDLRCLEVLPNGDVKLTWIPPSDPGNQFTSYDVYFSILRTGTFALVSTNLNSLNTTTFVHTTTVSTAQSCYYYLRANYGSAPNTSISSDTLRSIFLNSLTNTNNGTQEFKYNAIHTPKLSSTSTNLVLNKEYPLGTWNILTAGTGTLYPDTITVCNAKMNYQVSLADNSGCVSLSNLLMGDYVNIKKPERPYVDSISVLSNGQTVIGWQIPIDKDINQYDIYYNGGNGAINSYIDSLKGRENTSYTYTTPTANSIAIGVFVQAKDSCGNGSSVNYQIRTMFLQPEYDRCAYSTKLSWNKYIWSDIKGVFLETTGKYKIYCSVNNSAFQVVGETKDTNFVHKGVAPGKNVCYFVRVVNERQTITASSNRTCFFSGQVDGPQYLYLKTASVKNESSIDVGVYVDDTRRYQGVTIQRSETKNDFKEIAFIPFTGLANYSYEDKTVKPHLRSYYYRALVKDSCGNPRDSSNVAKTIFLKVHSDEAEIFSKQLSWSEYEGFNGGIAGYNVLRVINDDFNNALVGTTDALTTTYTDNIEGAASQGAKIEYVVQAVEGIGNIYGILELSSSNPVAVYMEGNIYVPNAFAPRGVNTTWLPITHFIEKTDYHVSVFNRWGKKVFETNDDTKAWDGSNCTPDVYVYLIDYKNARGEYMQMKGNVLLLR